MFPTAMLQYSTRSEADWICARAHIDSQHGRRVDALAKLHEFVGAKLIGLKRLPGEFAAAWTLLLGTDAIEPVVSAQEVAAWIANDRIGLIAQGLASHLCEDPGHLREAKQDHTSPRRHNVPCVRQIHQRAGARWGLLFDWYQEKPVLLVWTYVNLIFMLNWSDVCHIT